MGWGLGMVLEGWDGMGWDGGCPCCQRDAFLALHARYNNQWMVVDYNAFKPGRASLAPGVLTVLEQIP